MLERKTDCFFGLLCIAMLSVTGYATYADSPSLYGYGPMGAAPFSRSGVYEYHFYTAFPTGNGSPLPNERTNSYFPVASPGEGYYVYDVHSSVGGYTRADFTTGVFPFKVHYKVVMTEEGGDGSPSMSLRLARWNGGTYTYGGDLPYEFDLDPYCFVEIECNSGSSWSSRTGTQFDYSVYYGIDGLKPADVNGSNVFINGSSEPGTIRQNGSPVIISVEGIPADGEETRYYTDISGASRPINVISSGFSHYLLTIDGARVYPVWPTSNLFILPLLSSADHTLTVRTADGAGNVSDGWNKTIRIDDAPPSVPGIPSRSAEYYKNGDGSFRFSWTPSSDQSGFSYGCSLNGPSGYREIGTGSAAAVSINSFSGWNGLADGEYTFSVWAVDVFGQTSGSRSVTFFADSTSPPVPSPPEVFFASDGSFIAAATGGSGGTVYRCVRNGNLKMGWSCAQESTGQSGIASFAVAASMVPDGHWSFVQGTVVSDFPSGVHSTLRDLSPFLKNSTNSIDVKIVATDRAGNMSESTAVRIVLDSTVPAPVADELPEISVRADSISWKPVTDPGAGLKEYRISLVDPVAYAGATEPVTLSLIVNTSGTVKTPAGTIIMDASAAVTPSSVSLSVNAFNTAYGAGASDGRNRIKTGIRYRGYIEATDMLGNTSLPSDPGCDFFFTLDNVPVTIGAQSGMTDFSSIPADGAVYSSVAGIPAVRLKPSGTDPVLFLDKSDGDSLELSAVLTDIHGTSFASPYGMSGSVEIPGGCGNQSFADGNYRLSVHIREYLNVFTVPDGSAVTRVNKNIVRYPSEDPESFISFHIDTAKPPAPILAVGCIPSGEAGFTRFDTIALSISGIADTTSGIIYADIWNSDHPCSPLEVPPVNQAVSLNCEPPARPGIPLNIDLTVSTPSIIARLRGGERMRLVFSRPIREPVNVNISGWPLSTETGDGIKHIACASTDAAGFLSDSRFASVTYDTVKPDRILLPAYEYGHSADGISWDPSPRETVRLVWTAPDDKSLSRYLVRYQVEGIPGIRTAVIRAGADTSAILSLDPAHASDGVGWNVPVWASVVAVDRAGNESSVPGELRFATRARIATLRSPTSADRFSANAGAGNVHSLTISPAEPSEIFKMSNSQILKIYLGTEEKCSRTFDSGQVSGTFTGVRPHESGYTYKMIAVNASGDEFSSDFMRFPIIPNLIPSLGERPDLIGTKSGNLRFIGPVLSFSTASLPEIDAESDVLSYDLTVSLHGTHLSATSNFSPRDGTVTVRLDEVFPAGVPDGGMMDWVLTVRDAWGGSDRIPSDTQAAYRLVVDRTAPVFTSDLGTLDPSGSNILNATRLTISGITDPVINGASSGLSETVECTLIPYSDSGAAGLPRVERIAISGTTAELPLPHGRFALRLSVADRVGNAGGAEIGEGGNNGTPIPLIVDRVKPCFYGSDATDGGTCVTNLNPSPAGKRYLSTGYLSLRLSAVDPRTDPDLAPDDFPDVSTGIRTLRYWFSDSNGNIISAPSGNTTVPWAVRQVVSTDEPSVETDRTVSRTMFLDCSFLTDGIAYALHMMIEDPAGNLSETFSFDPFIMDRSAPGIVFFRADGKSVSACGEPFVTSLQALQPMYGLIPDAQTEASGLKPILFGIKDESTGLMAGETDAGGGWKESLDSIVPVDGKKYRLGIRVENGAGLSAIRFDTDAFVYDTGNPSVTTLTLSPSGPYSPGRTVSARIRASDGGTGIAAYSVTIIDDNAQADVSSRFADSDILSDYTRGTGGQFIRSPCTEKDTLFTFRFPPDFPAGRYRLTVRVKDSAGFTGEQSVSFSVSTGGGIAVSVPSARSASSDAFRFTWTDPFPAGTVVDRYDYALLNKSDSGACTEVAAGSIAGTWQAGTGYTISGLSLVSGCYTLRLTALVHGGTSVSGDSIDVLVDSSLPEFSSADGNPEAFIRDYCGGKELHASWNASDDESGIARVSVRLFGYLPPVIAGDMLDALIAGSTGTENPERIYEYYETSTDPENGAVMYRLRGTVPGSSAVSLTNADKAEVRAFFMRAGFEFEASGGPISVAANSGRTVCKISRDATGRPLDLSTGDVIYARIRVENGVGSFAERTAGPVIVDDSPPPAPVVTPSSPYYNTDQLLSVSWSFLPDEESGISSYSWSLLRDRSEVSLPSTEWHQVWDVGSGDSPVLLAESVTNPGAESPSYIFAVRAVNGAGAESIGMSSPIVVDATAPYVPEVRITRAVPGGTENIFFCSTLSDLSLYIRSFDPESFIRHVSFDFGTVPSHSDGALSVTAYVPTSPPGAVLHEVELLKSLTMFAGSLSCDVMSPTVFRVCSENTAGISGYGLSPGFVHLPGSPEIECVSGFGTLVEKSLGTYVPDSLFFSWQPRDGGIPVFRYVVSLLKDGIRTDGFSNIDCNQNRFCSLDITEFGTYRLEIRAYGINGTVSVVTSPELLITAAPPVIDICEAPLFADTLLSIRAEFRGVEDGTGASLPSLRPKISEYQYRFGSYEDRGAYTGGWKTISPNLQSYSVSCDLKIEVEHAPDLSTAYGTFRVRNSLGIWTEAECPEAGIDHSPASVESFTVGMQYTNDPRTIDELGLIVSENSSGISAYRLGIQEETEGSPVIWPSGAETVFSPGSEPLRYQIDDTGVSFPESAPELKEGTKYRAAVQVRNRAGTWSVPAYSPFVCIDRTPPVLVFGTGSESGRYLDSDGRTILVMNFPPFTFRYTVTDELHAEGGATAYVIRNGTDQEFAGGASAGFVREGEIILDGEAAGIPYGHYRIEATAADAAGNISQTVLNYRYNAPPVFSVPSYADTVPGRPVILSTDEVSDMGIDYPLTCTWRFGDYDSGGTEYTEVTSASMPAGGDSDRATVVMSSGNHPFFQNGRDPVVTRTVTVSIADRWGVGSVHTGEITVRTSVSGTLFANEIWSGRNDLIGSVSVPPGILLSVLPDSSVLVPPGAAILVSGELKAGESDQPAVLFDSGTSSSSVDWQGIRVEGVNARATLSNVTVTHALRGIALGPGVQSTIHDSRFIGNRVGIHAFGSSPLITLSGFTDNEWYAVKEDAVAGNGGNRPKLVGCRFASNGFDYYHETLRTLTADELNDLPENSLNGKGD